MNHDWRMDFFGLSCVGGLASSVLPCVGGLASFVLPCVGGLASFVLYCSGGMASFILSYVGEYHRSHKISLSQT